MTGWLLFGVLVLLSWSLVLVMAQWRLSRDYHEIRDLWLEVEVAAAMNATINEALTECLEDARLLHQDDEEDWFVAHAVKRTH